MATYGNGLVANLLKETTNLLTEATDNKKPDVGTDTTSNIADVGSNITTQQQQTPAPIYGSGYGSYGSYGGYRRSGGGGSSKPSKEDQEKLQATVDNLGDIYGRKKGDLEKQTKANLNVIKQKQKANNAALKSQKSQINRNVEWQPQQQKEQSMMMALRNRMGNAAYGSGIVDLMEGMGRVDDMADTQLIDTWKQNMDNAYNNWFQADTELVGDYNEALADAEQKMGDLLNQYQAALNNVNPLAAKTKNIEKAGAAVEKADKNKAAIKNAQKALTSAQKDAESVRKQIIKSLKGNQRAQYIAKKNQRANAKDVYLDAKHNYSRALADLKQNGNVKEIAAAEKALKSAKDNYLKSKDDLTGYYDTLVDKSKLKGQARKTTNAVTAAKDALKAAKKKSTKASSVSVGKGTEKITLPSISMSPSAAFSKLMANKAKNASAVNPLTSDYVRPDRATTSLGGTRGNFNTAGNANSGFADNLRAFRR